MTGKFSGVQSQEDEVGGEDGFVDLILNIDFEVIFGIF